MFSAVSCSHIKRLFQTRTEHIIVHKKNMSLYRAESALWFTLAGKWNYFSTHRVWERLDDSYCCGRDAQRSTDVNNADLRWGLRGRMLHVPGRFLPNRYFHTETYCAPSGAEKHADCSTGLENLMQLKLTENWGVEWKNVWKNVYALLIYDWFSCIFQLLAVNSH